jgi:Uri superfamily endonuclease
MKKQASTGGTYVLLLECAVKAELSIGKLGSMKTGPGYYLYVGSAFGPGGVRARIKHHRKTALLPHWHIDYLRPVAGLVEAWCVYGRRCEHEWAQILLQSENIETPLPCFGSSDCACETHLFQLEHKPAKAELEELLNSKLSAV